MVVWGVVNQIARCSSLDNSVRDRGRIVPNSGLVLVGVHGGPARCGETHYRKLVLGVLWLRKESAFGSHVGWWSKIWIQAVHNADWNRFLMTSAALNLFIRFQIMAQLALLALLV